MNPNFYIVVIGTWFLFMILAIINGAIRNKIYKPIVGDLTSHQISTIILIILIIVATYLILKFSDLKLSNSEAFLMGTILLVLTVTFELIIGHFVFGNTWEKLFADYNILKRRVWSLVLVTTFFAPYLTNKLI